MAVLTGKINNDRNVAIVYSGDVVELKDDGIRILVNDHYPKTYVDINKNKLIDIFKKYIIDEEFFKEKIIEIIEDHNANTTPVVPEDPDITPTT